MLPEHRSPQCPEVHYRKNARLLEETLLLGPVIREQPSDIPGGNKTFRSPGRDDGVDLTAGKHGREAGVGAWLILHPRRQLQLDLLRPPGLVNTGLQPADFGEIDALFLRQNFG